MQDERSNLITSFYLKIMAAFSSNVFMSFHLFFTSVDIAWRQGWRPFLCIGFAWNAKRRRRRTQPSHDMITGSQQGGEEGVSTIKQKCETL